MERRHPLVANVDEISAAEGPRVGGYGSQIRSLGRATGGKQLGCNHFEVEPGHAAFPFHWHAANEEALFVVSGSGILRLGDAEIALRPGDWAAFPTGREHPHQLRNDGTETLRYLVISTKISPDIAGYPDSKKLGLLGTDIRAVFREEDTVDYFERDPRAKG